MGDITDKAAMYDTLQEIVRGSGWWGDMSEMCVIKYLAVHLHPVYLGSQSNTRKRKAAGESRELKISY